MTLGERICVIRERRQWSQNELSRKSGVRQALISELESGKKLDTTGSVLKRLAETLGVTVDYLVGMYGDGDDVEPAGMELVAPVCHAGSSSASIMTEALEGV